MWIELVVYDVNKVGGRRVLVLTSEITRIEDSGSMTMVVLRDGTSILALDHYDEVKAMVGR